jgi:3',5'-cyclic-nucleotide phosphodiesterase
MLNDLLVLGCIGDDLPSIFQTTHSPQSSHIISFDSIKNLIEYLLLAINYSLEYNKENNIVERVDIVDFEKELDYSVTIYIHPHFKTKGTNDSLNNLSINNLISLLKYRFLNLNPIIISNDNDVNDLSNKLKIIENNLSTRLIRVKSWIGFENDNFNQLNTMINYLNTNNLNDNEIKLYTNLLSTDINYDDLLINLNSSSNNDEYLINSFNKWDFNAFQFNFDELLKIGYLILIKFNKISNSNNLKCFLFFIRDNYRIGNPFHNFRHAIDVLQATNYFFNCLLSNSKFKITQLDCFALLLASLGHDIGHPGITNVFLSNINSSLSNIFENNSILEKFHKYQFKNILLPYLKNSIQSNNLNVDLGNIQNLNYLIEIIDNSILATDMAKHDEFVKKIIKLKDQFDNFKLLSCLLIKCADISNVCRLLNTSCKWGLSLSEEFKQINYLDLYFKENNLKYLNDDLITNNFNKQIKNINASESIQLVKNLPNNQMFFINIFANEFFTKISDTIPQLKFLIDNLNDNTQFWTQNQITQ